MVTETRLLLLLRHAEAEATRPGFGDRDRRLTEHGQQQAAAVGETIRAAGWAVDHVLCSAAVRTRETLAGLALPTAVPVELVDGLYDAGSTSIIELVESLPHAVRCPLVVGHAPGVPGVVHELVSGPDRADPAAWSVIATRFPPATLAALRVAAWPELPGAHLVHASLH